MSLPKRHALLARRPVPLPPTSSSDSLRDATTWRAPCYLTEIMGTDAAATRDAIAGPESTAGDMDLLLRLSGVHAGLLRCRQEASIARTRLKQARTRIAQVEAILSADRYALTALRANGDSDRVAVELLENAVSGGQSAYESAGRELTRAANELRPLLVRLSRNIESLESDKRALRAQLSLVAARIYELLVRRDIVPFVACVDDGSCGECHLPVPTAIVNSIVANSSLRRCPFCTRVLVSGEPMTPSLR
jgi:hypothetical protein